MIDSRKPFRLLSIAALAATVLLGSCSKDDESVRPRVEFPDDFSNLSPEENKMAMEDNAAAFMDDMDALTGDPGVQALGSFSTLTETAPLPNGRKAPANNAFSMMRLLGKFGNGETTGRKVLEGFRSADHVVDATPEEDFDSHAGTYVYNKATNQWSFTAGSDKIIFKFPSTETGTTNDAELSIYSFATVRVVRDGIEDYMPTSLKADLKVADQKRVEYVLAASYKSNGDPTSVNTSLTVGVFKLSFSGKNTTSEIGATYAISKSNATVLAFGVGATGNFDTGDANASLNKASAFFQIKNIKFAGEINVETFAEAMQSATTIQDQVDAYNEATRFVVFYADSKKKIADSEFYVGMAEQTWEECYDYDGDWIYDDCETYTETYETAKMRLIFQDNSKADIETYFNEGFESFRLGIEELLLEISQSAG